MSRLVFYLIKTLKFSRIKIKIVTKTFDENTVFTFQAANRLSIMTYDLIFKARPPSSTFDDKAGYLGCLPFRLIPFRPSILSPQRCILH